MDAGQPLLDFSARLAARLGPLLERGDAPLLPGGDCSLLLGVGLGLRARGDSGH